MDCHGQVDQPIGWAIIRSADSIRMDLISETNLCDACSHFGASCRVGGVGASNSEFELQIFAPARPSSPQIQFINRSSVKLLREEPSNKGYKSVKMETHSCSFRSKFRDEQDHR